MGPARLVGGVTAGGKRLAAPSHDPSLLSGVVGGHVVFSTFGFLLAAR